MTEQILREGADLASSVAGDLRAMGPLTVSLNELGATSWASAAARHDLEQAVADAVRVAVTAPHRPAGFAVTTLSDLLNARSLLVTATILVRPGSEVSQAFTATLDGAAGTAHVSLRGSPSIDGVPWQAPPSMRPAVSSRAHGTINPTSASPAWPPAPLPVPPRTTAPPPFRPPGGSRPAARPGNAVLGSVAVGYVLFSILWKLAIFVLVIGSIVGYIWGAGNDAHVRCLDHRLGAPGLIDSLACVFEH